MHVEHTHIEHRLRAARAIHVAFVVCCVLVLMAGDTPNKATSTVSLFGITINAQSFWLYGGAVALALMALLLAHLLSIRKHLKGRPEGGDKLPCAPWLALDPWYFSVLLAIIFTVVLPGWVAVKAYDVTATPKPGSLVIYLSEPSTLLLFVAAALGIVCLLLIRGIAKRASI